MATGQRVLVIDGLSETEEVLRAVLEPRGLHVQRIRGSHSAPAAADAPPPSVIVLHDESHAARAPQWKHVPRVIIGSATFPERAPTADRRQQYLAKPFHYRELIAAIEQLLATGERAS